ncbi:MAG TPA: hypothetical protein VGE76_05770 [Opitutaceae bacterium]
MRFLNKHAALEKELRRLEREESRLSWAYWRTPAIPLEHPYQRGWVKTFALEPPILQWSDAQVFRDVLRVINNRVYSRNREFRSPRGFPIELHPRGIGLRQWEKLAWPASHRRFFRLGHWRIVDEEFRHPQSGMWRRGYKLAVDWWLREELQPWMVTHQRVDLPEVKTRLAEIEGIMLRTCGRMHLSRLHGRSVRYRGDCEDSHAEDVATLRHRDQHDIAD